ncbi:MAG TPA: hypothetical protein VJI97_02100 [Candidatus Nanoarchaeia archaeon]|nr:hypothetical protein [Candidatus Nanoarchaeia archaeon]
MRTIDNFVRGAKAATVGLSLAASQGCQHPTAPTEPLDSKYKTMERFTLPVGSERTFNLGGINYSLKFLGSTSPSGNYSPVAIISIGGSAIGSTGPWVLNPSQGDTIYLRPATYLLDTDEPTIDPTNRTPQGRVIGGISIDKVTGAQTPTQADDSAVITLFKRNRD